MVWLYRRTSDGVTAFDAALLLLRTGDADFPRVVSIVGFGIGPRLVAVPFLAVVRANPERTDAHRLLTCLAAEQLRVRHPSFARSRSILVPVDERRHPSEPVAG